MTTSLYMNLNYLDDFVYLGHTCLAATNNEIDNNDWIYNTESEELMIKLREIFIDYKSLSKLLIIGVANDGIMKIYNIDSVCISMKFMNIIVKNVYYIFKIVANLISLDSLIDSGYWAIIEPDCSFKITN